MKKSLISGIAMIAISVGAANADVTEQSCNNGLNTIWDSKEKVCLPKDPCHSKLYKNNSRYCNRAFRKTQVASVEIAQRLINIYVQAKLGSNGHCKEFLPVNLTGDPKSIGDDFIGCVTQKGEFVSFLFDDVSESFKDVSDGNFYRAACTVLGGTPEDGGAVTTTAVAAGATNVAVTAANTAVLGPISISTAAAIADIDQTLKASISGCQGLTEKQCHMIDPMSGYNSSTKLCQFLR